MKKTITVLLILGMLLAGMGALHAAQLTITANVSPELSLALSEASLDFDPVVPGVATDAQQLKATTSGSGLYNLQISNTTFARTGGGTALPVSALQYRVSGGGTYANGSTSPTFMLGSPATAVPAPDGDEKEFDFRMNVAAAAEMGIYTATVTITAVPQ